MSSNCQSQPRGPLNHFSELLRSRQVDSIRELCSRWIQSETTKRSRSVVGRRQTASQTKNRATGELAFQHHDRAAARLYTSSNTIFQGKAYADGRENTINQPCLTIYGTTVEDSFY